MEFGARGGKRRFDDGKQGIRPQVWAGIRPVAGRGVNILDNKKSAAPGSQPDTMQEYAERPCKGEFEQSESR